jgi:hypothetical protein
MEVSCRHNNNRKFIESEMVAGHVDPQPQVRSRPVWNNRLLYGLGRAAVHPTDIQLNRKNNK